MAVLIIGWFKLKNTEAQTQAVPYYIQAGFLLLGVGGGVGVPVLFLRITDLIKTIKKRIVHYEDLSSGKIRDEGV